MSRRNPPPRASKQEEPPGTDAGQCDGVAEIVAGCQRGDREAQRRLYDRFHRQVFRLMVRMVGTQEAEDVTQQVFLQLYRSIGKYSRRGRFETWLYRVAVNESYQHLRRSKRWKHGGLEYEPMDSASGSGEVSERKELVEKGLARLDPQLRSLCLLREIEGLSYQELAATLGIPEGTVGSRLNRARRELKQHLLDLGWEP